MKIKFWGTRGSIPTPSTSSFLTKHYGGDTTCISIEFGENGWVILDAGSGLRLLGLEMLKRKRPIHATFFFTHVHWDHIQGFPFYLPGFIPENTFELYGPALNNTSGLVGSVLEKALRGQQQDLNFPVQLQDMPAKMNFRDMTDTEVIELENHGVVLKVSAAMLNHPGGCLSYRIEEHSPGNPVKVLTMATDTEHLSDINPNLQRTAKNADILIYDGQYTPEEYDGRTGRSKVGWGHSTWEWGIRESLAAGVKRLMVTHHDPLHDDELIGRIDSAARDAGDKVGLMVEFAHQFQEVVL